MKLTDLLKSGLDTVEIAEALGGVAKGWSEGQHPLCSIPGCGKLHCAQGYCDAHYRRFRRHGDPLGGRLPPGERKRWINEVAMRHSGEGCLTWPFVDHKDGYGRLRIDGRTTIASRYVCKLVHGAPPTPKHEAAHNCGKGHLGCVAPGHLEWKTPKQNHADKLEHGTSNRGERHGLSKLTEADVIQVMALKGKESRYKIAKRFGVTYGAVSEIHRGRNWSWLTNKSPAGGEVRP